jgi:hypothetical protein
MAQKYRTLVTGRRVRETKENLKWGFESKCPGKWIHIDTEDNHIYVADVSKTDKSTYVFKEPTQVQINAAIKSLKQWRPR